MPRRHAPFHLLAFSVVGLLSVSLVPQVPAQMNSYERAPINYLHAEVHDPVAELAGELKSGAEELAYDSEFGYLQSVLQKLDIPVSSQTLVFSKTSLQISRISPRRPRALYFNDDVYVGYCQQGKTLELAATDAQQGAIFYTIDQSDDGGAPAIVRDRGQCLSCHVSTRTQRVPGFLVRSVFANAAGRPQLGSGTFTTDQTSDFRDRWGGWYVTGQHGSMRHMGNTISDGDEDTFDRDPGANEDDLSDRFHTAAYLTPHSDIVALMVLEHQTQMHNAITAANYETRQALHQSYQMNELLERPKDFLSDSAQRRISSAADQVLEYLLFCDEFQLTDSVSGTTSFARDFESHGKQDPTGRSLRELDLQTRLFTYPCSYLIYSDAFAGLPDEVRSKILTRLFDILENRDESERYAHLSEDTRAEILAILRETHPEFQRIAVAQR
ncbi:GAT domain-containing protein [Allorhodopirellula solitaria]|uniref:Cytochrome c domain-containing protein n=1 Tax=Allorhodopirellula solitaria TaxID=2527987 RepID=A0A5C5XW99_9BACT|nr:hypothetical protein [Allorhodopirellula solitaria]TWT67190.1 hypothetical protein CA85_20390 [Allorhodopirellula solitaria]